jgi:hypothetical protein
LRRCSSPRRQTVATGSVIPDPKAEATLRKSAVMQFGRGLLGADTEARCRIACCSMISVERWSGPTKRENWGPCSWTLDGGSRCQHGALHLVELACCGPSLFASPAPNSIGSSFYSKDCVINSISALSISDEASLGIPRYPSASDLADKLQPFAGVAHRGRRRRARAFCGFMKPTSGLRSKMSWP